MVGYLVMIKIIKINSIIKKNFFEKIKKLFIKNLKIFQNNKNFTKKVSSIVLSNKEFNKIFCIGYNKTGTTSMQKVLRLYGYNLPNQQEQERQLSKPVFENNYTELIEFCKEYDAFQDMPFSQGLTYVAADALFPNSKFILTERDSNDWFNSMTTFHKKIFKIDDISKLTEKDILQKFTYLYPGYAHANISRLLAEFDGDQKVIRWDKLYDKKTYIEMYESRNIEIKRFFTNSPHKLLVIDISKESDTSRICEFLNIPLSHSIKMPQENKT